MDLILCRAAIIQNPESLDTMTICANHRGKLGLGWTRCSTMCRIPVALSNHGEGSRKAWPKGDRGIGKRDSEIVLDVTGVFIQAGSGKIMYTIFKLLVVIASWLIRFHDVAVSICKWVAKCKPLRFHASFLLLGICKTCREKLKTQ